MKYIYIFLVLFCSLAVNGQQAPDFTITDYNNETHELYADYLNQGKVVMIKIMFVDCPPCNSIAKSVQGLWEEFGGAGNPDVQFFELSNKNWDSNSDVLGFAQKHGITFIGAGSDGGSLQAVEPYVRGDFGTFFGTPTFVVIGKDGSVEFKVPFNQLKETIEAKINDSRQAVEGVVVDADGMAMENVGIYYQNPGDSVATYITQTNILGEYTFFVDDIPGEAGCVIFPQYDEPDHTAGVSTKDIIAVLSHVLRRDTLSTPLKIFSADTEGSGHVSVKDLVEIRRIILGLTNRFDLPNGFVFIYSEDNIPGALTGRKELLLSDIVEGTVSANFTGAQVGNVID